MHATHPASVLLGTAPRAGILRRIAPSQASLHPIPLTGTTTEEQYYRRQTAEIRMAHKVPVKAPEKTVVSTFRTTPEQSRAMAERAAGSGVKLGTWVRSILVQAASQKPRKGYLRIREPDGAT